MEKKAITEKNMNIPISKVYLNKDEEKAVIEVLRSGWIMQGPKGDEFEEILANYIGVKHAILVSSGTAALHLAMIALGIGPGDEVIVPSFSFVTTAHCVLYVGAKPVFADIDPRTYNIDPRDILRKITKKTKAILVVHQIGLAADMEPILKIAEEKKLSLVEDAACALGATYNGKMVGNFSNIACFSFHPRKTITTAEGGLLTTNNAQVAELLRSLRSNGIVKKNGHEHFPYLGFNYRLTDVQVAIGLAQFKKLPLFLKKRKKLAEYYNTAFAKTPQLQTPYIPENRSHTYQSYMLRVTKGRKYRDNLLQQLLAKGIMCKASITAIHKEPLYQKLFGTISLPETEKASDEGLLIPLHAQMTKEEQQYVINNLLRVLTKT